MSDQDQDEIILKDLNDDDLVQQMQDDLYDGMIPEVTEGTQILLDRGWDANTVLNNALVEGMKFVGDDFRDGILFVPEVLQACLLYTSPSPRDKRQSRMPSSA